MTYYHSDGKISYPISELKSGTINYDTLIELIIDEYGDGTYISKNATIGMFGDYLVSSHAIFNILNNLFNDKTIVDTSPNGDETYRYASDLYFQSATYFLDNPWSKETRTRIEGLTLNQTITKRELQRYIQEHGFEIDTIKNYYEIFEWNHELSSWELNSTPPMLTEISNVPFNVENKNLIQLDSEIISTFYHGNSSPIITEKNTIVNVIGIISLPKGWNKPSTKYFIPEYNLWVALLNRKNNKALFGITELHNIVDVDDVGIAYFSMSIPMSIDTRFSIVMPFEPGESIQLDNSGTLFEGITSTNNAIAYYWGENAFTSDDSDTVVDPNTYS